MPIASGCRRWEDTDQRVQTRSYKMNKSQDLKHSTVITVNNTALCTCELLEEYNFVFSSLKNNSIMVKLCRVKDVLTSLTVEISS